MGYIFLILALFCGSAKGYCGKKTSGLVSKIQNITLLNIIRMVICIIIGAFFVIISSKGFNGFIINSQELLVCFVSGLSTSLFVIFWILCIRQNAYTMIAVFLTVATFIPVLISYFIFDEEIKTTQIIGFLILIVAVFFMTIYNSKLKNKTTIKGVIFLFCCCLSYGATLFSQKWRYFTYEETLSAYTFNFYTFVFSAITLAIIFAFIKRKDCQEKFQFKNILLYIIIMAICLFLNSLFTTFASVSLPSAILYPLQQGASLVLSLFMGQFFFNEKIKTSSIIGIALSISSFIIMVF